MYSVDGIFLDPRPGFNIFSMFSSVPFLFVPCVVAWHLTVQKALGKLVILAKGEEGSECCCRRLFHSLPGSFFCKVNSLTILKVYCKSLNCGMVLMYIKAKYAPSCFTGSCESPYMKLLGLIAVILLNTKDSHVRAFVDIFTHTVRCMTQHLHEPAKFSREVDCMGQSIGCQL